MSNAIRIARMVFAVIKENLGESSGFSYKEEGARATIETKGFPCKRAVFDIQCGTEMCTIDQYDSDRQCYVTKSEMKAYQFEKKLVFLSGMLVGELTTY